MPWIWPRTTRWSATSQAVIKALEGGLG